jgi:dihydroneopterin aldolase
MPATAMITLRDLALPARIGTPLPGETVPDAHLLDLTLWIDPALVLVAGDGMAHVFDYDPLLTEIDRLARDGHQETQEWLMSRIARACVRLAPVTALEVALRKHPVGAGGGSLGLRLHLDEAALAALR